MTNERLVTIEFKVPQSVWLALRNKKYDAGFRSWQAFLESEILGRKKDSK